MRKLVSVVEKINCIKYVILEETQDIQKIISKSEDDIVEYEVKMDIKKTKVIRIGYSNQWKLWQKEEQVNIWEVCWQRIAKEHKK